MMRNHTKHVVVLWWPSNLITFVSYLPIPTLKFILKQLKYNRTEVEKLPNNDEIMSQKLPASDIKQNESIYTNGLYN